MAGRHIVVAADETVHELGRYLVINGPRPDWFATPASRSTFEIPTERTLELIRVKYFKTVKRYKTGHQKVDYATAPLDESPHELVVPAGSMVRVLPDFSFFISDVLIRHGHMRRHFPGQAAFYPPAPGNVAVSHHRRERLEYSIAIQTYSGSRF